MHLIRKFRIPALFCALAVLLCELISRPYASMGISDDWPYIVMTQTLAATGHIVYNGWPAAMLGWQLYLGAAFIKLFGFSPTTVRMSTLLVAVALAFVLQRTLVRAGISERNATIGTLALVVSPLYLMLSVTFMSDIQGLFAIVLCLYGCLRALQSSTSRAAIAWLCFAVATNAICGTSRQIAWLGVLVMVPSTLWLLRAQRRVLLAGAAATLAGFLFIFACLHWFKHQPYTQPVHIFVKSLPVFHVLWDLLDFFLDVPFLLLPIVVLFFSGIRKSSPRVLAALFLGYLFVTVHPRHIHHVFLLEPTPGKGGDWVGVHGIHEGIVLNGMPPIFLHTGMQVLLTFASFGGLLCLIALLISSRRTPLAVKPSPGASWKQLGILLGPFTFAYALLLLPSAASTGLFDRYLLGALVGALLCMVRYYQDRIQPRLPLASIVMVAIMAIYGIAVTHNMFALYRARIALAAEIRAAGVPDTSVDNGWEYNFGVELQHANFINDPRMGLPAHAYVPTPRPPAGPCQMWWYDKTPHIHPRYSVSFDPNACYGPAPFAPMHYSRWLASSPGTLYVVDYTAPTKQ
jgi:hypothetical protein